MIHIYEILFLTIFNIVFLINFIQCQDNETSTEIISCTSEIFFIENHPKKVKLETINNTYSSNLNCSFLFQINSTYGGEVALLTFNYIDTEEPIFGECSDYLSLYSIESENKTNLITKLCGTYLKPLQIISDSHSISAQFISDDIVQKSGFEITYESFTMPGCPPDWIVSSDGRNCYYVYTSNVYNLSWINAQKMCTNLLSNLITFSDYKEFDIFLGINDKNNETFWIGYNDFQYEGIIDTITKDEYLKTFNNVEIINNEENDCMALSVYNNKSYNLKMYNCRERKSFICKRSFNDKTEVKYIKNIPNIEGSNLDKGTWVFYIFLSLTIIFLLAILYCLIIYCKNQKARVRIGNHDQNQMLVQDNKKDESRRDVNNKMESLTKVETVTTKVKKIKKSGAQLESRESNYNDAKFDMKANQPEFIIPSKVPISSVEELIQKDKYYNNNGFSSGSLNNSLVLEGINLPNTISTDDKKKGDNDSDRNQSISSKSNLLEINNKDIETTVEDIKLIHSSSQDSSQKIEEINMPITKKVSAVIENNNSIINEKNNDPCLSLILDIQNKHFERPQQLKISNASAISLDEFWSNH
uniref:C-type lectin domain-containing protein n=1 Tax=Parastrongyloides trichosuri TaxID=131310 RepID=A0A0N5A695_PARTI